MLFFCATILLLFPFNSSARYDPSLKWRTLSTNNFVIYYPEGHELMAQRILSLSDEVHTDVTGYFGVEPRLCPIVLDTGTDIFNGFFSLFPNRISLYETPLYTVRGLGPASDSMDLVFTHEYTHYVNITSKSGWYGIVTNVLGDGLAISNMLSPGWLVEGITTNTETKFTDGGRGRSPLFRGEFLSFFEGDGLWNLNSAAVSSSYCPPGSRIYLGGYFMVEYMNRTYGEDAFAKLNRSQARNPLTGSGRALRRVVRKSAKQFYKDFVKDYSVQAESAREKAVAEGLPSGKVVLADDKNLESFETHSWTSSGTILAIRKGYDKKNAVVEADPATGKILSETQTGILTNLSARVLRDGRLLLAEAFFHPLGEFAIDTSDLVIFNPATREHDRITRSAHVFSADLSPDKKTFVATRRNGMWIDLALFDRDGRNIRALVSKPGMYFDAPCWSPDGSRIAAVVKSGRNSDIALVYPVSGSMELLFKSDPAEDNEPEFSPDGKWLIFSSDRNGTWNIYAWNLAEKKLFQVTSVPYVAGDPHISPDGLTISYSNMIRGVKQVCVLPFNPESGKAIEVEGQSAIEEPDLKRLQPEPAFTGRKGVPLEAYKPFIHIPYFSSDEKGEQTGVLLMGADPLGINTYSVNLLYGFESNRPGYDINITNKSFWPTLSGRVYDTSVEGNAIDPGKDFWYRERGAEVSAGFSIIHQVVPSAVTSSIRAGSRLRHFKSLVEDVHISEGRNQSTGVFGELTLSRTPDSSSRDMVTSWGENVLLSYEKGVSGLGGDFPGYNQILSVTQYLPSFVEHHGLALTAVRQSQKGALSYSKGLSIPRGYHSYDAAGGLNDRRNLLLSAEYHFPILYMDNGLGLYAYHSNLLKGSVFADYGAGWNGNFNWDSWSGKARTSVGVTLTNKCVLLAILPIEWGLEGGYKTKEKEGFVNFIFKADL